MTETISEPTTPVATDSAAHVRASERSKAVPLEWPVTFGGQVYTQIMMRRPTVAEVRDWSNRVLAARARGEAEPSAEGLIFDAPQEVLGILDPDDDDRLYEAGRPFLPRRLLGEIG